nr:sialate O-acetylesterase [Prevotella sp.]
RFINKYGRAYFINEKPYRLAFGADRMSLSPAPTDTIALSRTWKMKKGSVMIPHPGGGVSLQNQPSTLYNAVLHPLAPFALSGVVWYQGESNTGNPYTYDTLLRKMMGNWRSLWQQADLPFVIVQLANYMAPSATPQNSNWARLREAQRIVAKNDPRAALCVINDLGETVDIHPLRKKEVAERIGCCFDKLVYQKKKVQLSPEVIKATRIGDQIILSLDQQVANGPVYEFEVAGPDGKFENVEASADGQTICLKWPATRAATKVRYAWKDNPLRANVRSAGGWPMSSFEWQL